MRSRIIISGLVSLFVLLLGTSSYFYARAAQLENRIAQLEPLVKGVAQLEQTTKEQKAAIDRLGQTAREQKAAIDTLETMRFGNLNSRVSKIEIATQPLIDGSPILLCKPGLLTDISCDRVTFAKPSVSASNLPPGRFYYHDDANKLDRSTIERAAQSLVERGAQVAIYTVTNDGGPDDFLQRLQQDGLYSSGGVHPTLIAIYVSFSLRYSEIRSGDNWNNVMKTNNNIDTFRASQLNRGLTAGDYTGGIVNTFAAIEQAIISNP